MDERLDLYIWNVEHQMDGLVDGIENLTEEQMTWIPAGVKNPLSWILGHWADLFWLAFGMLSGETLPIRPDRPGVPVVRDGADPGHADRLLRLLDEDIPIRTRPLVDRGDFYASFP